MSNWDFEKVLLYTDCLYIPDVSITSVHCTMVVMSLVMSQEKNVNKNCHWLIEELQKNLNIYPNLQKKKNKQRAPLITTSQKLML